MRTTLHLAGSRRRKKTPRKTGKCSRREGVVSIQFSLMLNAIGCSYWAVTFSLQTFNSLMYKYQALAGPKSQSESGWRVSHFASQPISVHSHHCDMSTKSTKIVPCSWFHLSQFFSSFGKSITRKLPPKVLSVHGSSSGYQLGIGPSTAVLLCLPLPPHGRVVHLSRAVQEEAATCRWVRFESVEI